MQETGNDDLVLEQVFYMFPAKRRMKTEIRN